MSKGIGIIAVMAFVVFCVQPAVPHPHHVISQTTTTTTTQTTTTSSSNNIEKYRPGAMTIDRIREIGTIPNLNQGIEITINNIRTRLIAWPGQGMVQGALHLLTLGAGEETGKYRYPVSEEALECIQGEGEVYLWDKWVTIKAGDVAYFPEGVTHAIRNRKNSDFVLISQLTPPQLDLYEPSGLWDSSTNTWNQNRIKQLSDSSKPGKLGELTQLRFHDEDIPESMPMRAWRVDNATIRKKGALFNIFYGARFDKIGVPMVIVLFPGYGTRNAGLHTGIFPEGGQAHAHRHPLSDDCVIYLQGKGNTIIDGDSIDLDPLNAVAAPILASHGAGNPAPQRSLVSGYGAPPQPELYEEACYQQGCYLTRQRGYIRPEFVRIEEVEKSMKTTSGQ